MEHDEEKAARLQTHETHKTIIAEELRPAFGGDRGAAKTAVIGVENSMRSLGIPEDLIQKAFTGMAQRVESQARHSDKII